MFVMILNLNRDDQDKSGNCFPGTVVETGICHPMEWDFYLMSHGGLQVWQGHGLWAYFPHIRYTPLLKPLRAVEI